MIRPIHAVIAAYVLLAMAIQHRNGYYTPLALSLALAAFVILVLGLVAATRSRPSSDEDPWPALLAIGVALLALAGWARRPLADAPFRTFTASFKVFNFGLLAFACAWPWLSRREHLRRSAFGVLAVAAVALFIAVPLVSPSPRIDVFVMSSESADHLLEGLNPYTTPVSDAYEGAESFGYTVSAYMYPPATLYLQLIGHLAGDIRVMSVIAQLVVAAVLWWRAKLAGPIALFVPLLLFAHPRSYVVIEQAWTESLILLVLSAVVVLYASGNRLAAAAAYGFMVSLKQSMAFLVVPGLLLEKRLSYLLVAAGVAIATLVPFAIWDLESLWTQGLLFHMKTGYRSEALTVFAPFAAAFDYAPTRSWNLGVGAIVTVVTMAACRRMPPLTGFFWAGTATMFAVFLFGNKAYTNYYYFVGVLMLFLLAELMHKHSGPPPR